ncbi:alpha/beta hydrolase fold domain-containing protein [Psychroserpens sp.]|uniref:alpha/beta hydrolase fold domain-containing protein n=1 Tax=Psychroserpens sp. TaxID=2020870 RepID=UPI001B1CB346|nr:alpha/beta hydrolase fold domain-containing protein [Psychroserpens sp.]MBO6606119.1 alpha/beta hydrolase fold domain-containing protein [Psychroserpens sp.]MBO6630745.1 alpha/beta hydrolase fold domain-containing protein [Psychroserpens sp.]MBO6652510.1 alpha/beta hydrolase fold domain-containing protein [Psychroserpens sp.]MBO6681718.1 alpha/beta hydrolase fold domain-containing protein [Psychroserpens sp.]MBO6749493.1 alpha/beta hydrolase fold domain-containing protein [Psychroserpens sp
MTLKFTSFLFAIAVLFSCSSDDATTIAPVTQTPLITLEFTTPPIAVESTGAQFAADIPYDQYDKTTFDIFLPPSTDPTGLVIFIHGGGFTGGGKSFIYSNNYETEVIDLLGNGIAVATINYRLLVDGDTDGVLKCLNDSKRALQYIRYIHNELNIDKDKIVLFGSSAGASTSLWLAANDELRDLNSVDPVLQESTRVKGIALNATQSSLDIETRWLGDVFEEFEVTLDDIIGEFGEDRVFSFYGINSLAAYDTPEIDAYRQQVDMLGMLTSDDPEIWVKNTGTQNSAPMTTGSFNHHPFHAREIKAFADAAGVPTVATYGNPILYSDPSNESYVDFLMRKLNE